MTDDLALLPHGQMVLMVLPPDFPFRLVAAGVDEVLGQIEILLFSGRLRELDQGQLDFLVAGHALTLGRAKHAVDEVGVFDGHVQQRSLAGGAEMGDGGLDQVAGAIQLVHIAQVRQAFARLGQGEVGVQISVGLLGGGDLGDDLIDGFLQLGIGMGGQRIRSRFQHLVDVRIVEDQSLELAFHEFRRLDEVVDPAGPPAPLDVMRQRVACGLFRSAASRTHRSVSRP